MDTVQTKPAYHTIPSLSATSNRFKRKFPLTTVLTSSPAPLSDLCVHWFWKPVASIGCFPLCQRFRKFRLEFKWKGSFRFLLTGIFRITSGGCPHISVGIFRPKFNVPFLTNRFFALIRELGKRIKNDNNHFYWLARFNRKMSFHFPQVFPLISDRSVWHNGKQPLFREIRVLFGSFMYCFLNQ